MSHRISFRVRGRGAPLILLHGYGGSVHHWEAIASSLEGNFRVVVPNLSHLFMGKDKLFFSVQVQALAMFIRENFPGEKVHVAGLSYGGAMAWALATQYPELVGRMVLVNPMVPDPIKHFMPTELRFFFSIPLNLKSIYVLLSTSMGKAFLKRSAQLFRDERSEGVVGVETLTGRKLQFVAHMIHNFAWILRSEDWQTWNKKLLNYRGTCRLIFDKEDLLFNPEIYRKFAMQIGCEDLVSLTGAGHLAIKTRPDEISQKILEFIEHFRAA
ncbi:Soluble epoxide hydrolase [compost metagenome]